MHITLRTPTGSCPTPLTVRMCIGIMPPDMCSQRLSATTYGVSASMDAIDDVLAVSSAYCYGISRHIKDMMWRSECWNTHCVAVPMHLFYYTSGVFGPMSDYYPISAWLITRGMVRDSEASHGCTSLAHQFRNHRLLQSQAKRQAQRMAHDIRKANPLLSLFCLDIYKY